jgi:hypothetical protein
MSRQQSHRVRKFVAKPLCVSVLWSWPQNIRLQKPFGTMRKIAPSTCRQSGATHIQIGSIPGNSLASGSPVVARGRTSSRGFFPYRHGVLRTIGLPSVLGNNVSSDFVAQSQAKLHSKNLHVLVNEGSHPKEAVLITDSSAHPDSHLISIAKCFL